MSCLPCSDENNLAGASLCLIPGNPELRDHLAGMLAENNLIFERRGCMLALVGPREPTLAVELLRQILSEQDRREVTVASLGAEGLPVQHKLDDWWRIRETGWLEKAMAADDVAHTSIQPHFSVWFQPIVDTSSNWVVAHECLARVHSGTCFGTRRYSGSEIMDAAWLRRQERVVDTRLRSLALEAARAKGGQGRFFINFLPHTLYEPRLCLQETFTALNSTGITPSRVVFEAVQATGTDPLHLRNVADALRERGCGISLDDLGLSNGGLQRIHDIAPNYIKLAPSLVLDVETSVCASAIRRIVEAADRCGATVIAKNVECTRTMENLWLLGVQFMQGYLFGRPSPAPSATLPHGDLLHLAAALERPPALEYRN